MPTASDYVVVANSQTTLEVGQDIDTTYDFSLPNNINTGRSGVAVWLLEVDNPSSLRWNMKINGTQVLEFTHGQDRLGAFQEVLPASALQSGSNQAVVEVLSGSGQLRLSDFVIHFQVDV